HGVSKTACTVAIPPLSSPKSPNPGWYTARTPMNKADGTATPLPSARDSALFEARVVVEACPPSREDQDRAYAVLRQSFSCYNSFHAVSVPDLQDTAQSHGARHRAPNGDVPS